MRIAYVYDAVYPWETGGVQKRVWELARRLADDHDVHWYGLHYWDGPAVIEREGVTLHGVGEPETLYVDGRRSIPEALSFAARVARPLLSESFDVIDCQEFPYFPAFTSKLSAARHGATLVLTWHEVWGDYWYEYLGAKGVCGKLVERATAAVPDCHLAVSDRTRRDVASLGASDPRYLPNGISVAEVEDAPEADADVDVLFAGRLIPEKNADLLVRAMSRVRERNPDVQCTVVGEGPERDRIESLVADEGLDATVTVRDFYEEYEDVLGLMKAADALALPSEREGFGITALEAMACGTPVVTIDHPRNAATELVADGETGAVCDPTPEAVADGILAARACAPEDCVAAASEYDWDRLADRAETLYREVA
ncbi:glycosyltransferase family 4 protein [Halorussus caseinilyticus]|uniref:Glycosyltransferase family 4 protein n=1 Tax=Halorussus caseinilyticus TaxID=3034025 RepID=A0ABD5WLK7_9EURY|nr:glycosyltransferase family 4 protein [Halorussus sp. DT72]